MSPKADTKNSEKAAKTASRADQKPAKAKAPKGQPLPVLLEIAFTVCRVVIVLSCAIVAVVSYLAGVTLLELFIRVGATLLGLGFLLWGFTWFLTNGAIEARQAISQREKQTTQEDSGQNTFEVKA